MYVSSKVNVSSLTIGILADHADKNNKLFETLGKMCQLITF